ncbi:MAG: DivIVA domain-containing protein [Longimicrobiales bacterium]
MIDLTPIDVRKKKGDFRRAMRGYEPGSVDEFLELVAERMEELVKENIGHADRLVRLEERIAEYKERERALTDALVTAQEVREEVRRQAESAADLVRREAAADAERLRSEAMRIREQEEEGLRRLRARTDQFIQSYRRFLERELTELEVIGGSLDLRESAAPVVGRSAPRNARPARQPAPEAEEAAAAEPPNAKPPLFDLDVIRPDDADAAATDRVAEEDDSEPEWLSSLKEEGE